MKRLVIVLILTAWAVTPAWAYQTRRTDDNYFKRTLSTQGRGLMNVIGMPMEIIRTPVADLKNHGWAWPLTFAPGLISNIITRSVSALYDVGFSPFIYMFSNDTTPLTEPMGLSDYPWQLSEENF